MKNLLQWAWANENLRLIRLVGLFDRRYIGWGVELWRPLSAADIDVNGAGFLLDRCLGVQGVHFNDIVQAASNGLRRPNLTCVSVHLKIRATSHYNTNHNTDYCLSYCKKIYTLTKLNGASKCQLAVYLHSECKIWLNTCDLSMRVIKKYLMGTEVSG